MFLYILENVKNETIAPEFYDHELTEAEVRKIERTEAANYKRESDSDEAIGDILLNVNLHGPYRVPPTHHYCHVCGGIQRVKPYTGVKLDTEEREHIFECAPHGHMIDINDPRNKEPR